MLQIIVEALKHALISRMKVSSSAKMPMYKYESMQQQVHKDRSRGQRAGRRDRVPKALDGDALAVA